MSDLIELIRESPFIGTIIILSAIWATERIIVSIVNRNKPRACCEPECICQTSEDEEDKEGEEGEEEK